MRGVWPMNQDPRGKANGQMPSISSLFEVIAKATDSVPNSCASFRVIVMLDPSRNRRGFVTNIFTRQCHRSKTELRTEIIHLAWTNAAIAS